MSLTRRCLDFARRRASAPQIASGHASFSKLVPEPETDSCGIPLKPTWSVHDLLSSYPRPSISAATLRRLHELSALLPPVEGTPEHEKLMAELEELVRLVEAVRLVKVDAEDAVPDGRIWAEGTGIPLSQTMENLDQGGSPAMEGQDLLRHAARTANGMYLVNANRGPKS